MGKLTKHLPGVRPACPPPRPHIAAASADSDLVRLTREFEHLREQIRQNDDAINASLQRDDEATMIYNAVLEVEHGTRAQLQRERRTIETQFTNASELINQVLGNLQGVNPCISARCR